MAILSRPRSRFQLAEHFALVAVVVCLVGFFGIVTKHFFALTTLRTIANQSPEAVLVAVGTTYVLIIGGIDLSVGSVLGLSGAVLGFCLTHSPMAMPLALACCILAGAACGAINGLTIVRWALPSFIVTLGMLEAARGGTYLVAQSKTAYIGASVERLSEMGIAGISLSCMLAIGVVIVAQIVLTRTVFGRYMLAIGTNEEAVRLSGINPSPVRVWVFVISGTLAALAAVSNVSRLGAADPNAGIGLELSAIAAVVIGGTSLMGGRGSVINSLLGVVIIAVLENGLAQMGAQEPVKRLVTGAVIVGAVILDYYRTRIGRNAPNVSDEAEAFSAVAAWVEVNMKSAERVVVIGSINMDLVCRTPRIPAPGETIVGQDLITIPGGKGANQAVAAAKLARSDTEVHLIGRIGNDDFGQRLSNGLAQHHVRTQHVIVTEGVSSGCAMIMVDQKGENSIVVASGANAKLAPGDIDRAESLIAGASAVVLQLEVPIETALYAIKLCRRLKIHTILDPAPVPGGALPEALFDVDVLTPNETEAELLLERRQPQKNQIRHVSDPKLIGGELLNLGARCVVLKLGAKGSLAVQDDGQIKRSAPFKVTVADTTAAGDAFTGALAIAHVEGMALAEAARFANAAGAICCTHFGAQPALPTRAAVEELLNRPSKK